MPNENENTAPSTSPLKHEIVIPISKDVEKELKKMSDEELKDYFKPKVKAIYEQGKTISGDYITKDESFRERIRLINAQIKEEIFKEEIIGFLHKIGFQHSSTETEVSPPSKNAIEPDYTADPINLFNGNFVYSATDFTISGAGMDFSFTRNYSQLSFFNSILGYKWDHSFNLWLRLSGDTNLIFRSNGALREITYHRQTIHNYWFADFGEDGIIFERNGQFTWRSEEGIEFKYSDNLSGRSDILLIDRIEDRFGNYLQFSYQNNLLERVEVNHAGRLVSFKYDNENRIIAIADFIGRVWKYTYDDMGDLAAVTTPSTQEYSKGLTTFYEYSSYQYSSTAVQHNLLRIIDASGQIYLENEYGTEADLLSFNRVTRQRQGSGETYLEYEDVIEEFFFPYSSHQIPAHQTVETDRNGQQIRYLFNRFGNIVFREEYTRIDGIPKLISSHYRYNQDGNLVGTISPEGVITQFLYGRDYYERKFQIDEDYTATEDDKLTFQNRQSFNRLLASVKRGKYYNINALSLSRGLWSSDVFPDIFDVAEEDIIQKFVYEPEFGQPLSVSDPRNTKSANPDFTEDDLYQKQLTIYNYTLATVSSVIYLKAFKHLL